MSEAPDQEALARVMISALDIARQACFARKDWAATLERTDAILKFKREIKRPARDIALDQMNHANVLMRLNRWPEAKVELEECLQIFYNNPNIKQVVLRSLADLFDGQGDARAAVEQERRALAICEELPNPRDRAISHGNLSIYLAKCGDDFAEAARHRLARLVYEFASGLAEDLKSSFDNDVIFFRRALAAAAEPSIPRVVNLLADPAFHKLAAWLHEHQVDPQELQAAVDQFLVKARQKAQELGPISS